MSKDYTENKGLAGSEHTPGHPGGSYINTGLNTFRATTQQSEAYHGNLHPKTPTEHSMLLTSTNIEIYANGCVVGMIQSFNVSESRNINKLQAIGVEGVVQAVPGNTNGGQLSVSRIALYQSNMWNALGLTNDGTPYDALKGGGSDANKISGSLSPEASKRTVFKTLKEQRVPLEIQVKSKVSGDGDKYYVERYIDCWLQSYSKSYTVQQITVAEQATIVYSDVQVTS